MNIYSGPAGAKSKRRGEVAAGTGVGEPNWVVEAVAFQAEPGEGMGYAGQTNDAARGRRRGPMSAAAGC